MFTLGYQAAAGLEVGGSAVGDLGPAEVLRRLLNRMVPATQSYVAVFLFYPPKPCLDFVVPPRTLLTPICDPGEYPSFIIKTGSLACLVRGPCTRALLADARTHKHCRWCTINVTTRFKFLVDPRMPRKEQARGKRRLALNLRVVGTVCDDDGSIHVYKALTMIMPAYALGKLVY